MIGPTVKVYRNLKTGEYRVQPYAKHFGTPQEFGTTAVLQPKATADDLLRAVVDNLAKTETQKYDLATAPKLAPEEWRRILKEEQPVIIRQTEVGYEMLPMKRMRNSFGSIDEMKKSVPMAEFLSRGGEILQKLFQEIEPGGEGA